MSEAEDKKKSLDEEKKKDGEQRDKLEADRKKSE